MLMSVGLQKAVDRIWLPMGKIGPNGGSILRCVLFSHEPFGMIGSVSRVNAKIAHAYGRKFRAQP